MVFGGKVEIVQRQAWSLLDRAQAILGRVKARCTACVSMGGFGERIFIKIGKHTIMEEFMDGAIHFGKGVGSP